MESCGWTRLLHRLNQISLSLLFLALATVLLPLALLGLALLSLCGGDLLEY